MTGRRRRHHQLSPLPHRCAVLAVDTAARSGCALYVEGRLRESGEVRALQHAALVGIIEAAQGVTIDAGLRSHELVLVLERPWGGAGHTLQGLGGARALWLSAWCQAHGTRTPRRVVSVYPQTWRSRVLGRTRDTLEMERIRAVATRRDAHLPTKHLGADEAAAICIGLWAVHSPEVAAALPRPRRRQDP